ncbi:TetR/AcrR family transcriptional regulator [Plantactinospora sp. KLBMP9567]|uniref:TetR/AcrR family transcriptional regulator n=1 Tax=Plantactinospora sp. KLBMP9567 TaxID=3085900 RepID=UPI002982B1C0|nr:TetR/AcrR family transcriptional regulator [Plantactinospora sp. KLBMP9567]MDW5327955.1 TetR/AcrR family transcriptional regulator [Plantactinospora sp. KLBMP9567]
MSKGAATRQAVLAEATEVASRLGLGGLTIGSLAARLDMSKSGLFAHFRSKEALHLQVLDHARDAFTAEVVRPALRAPRGEARMRALFENWLRSVNVPGACLFVSASTEFDDQPGPVRDQLVADHRDLSDVIAQIFRTGIAEGQFDEATDPERFAHDLHSVMLGAFHARRLLNDPRTETWARHAFEALLDAARPTSD